ncbi:MAG: DUF2339 domain-containing protein [Phycisphaeraceae bacterium]|nr:DUF2339 domain-containing protein [Phycisphaeraceae bacterium]
MDERSIEEALRKLEARLERLEQRLGDARGDHHAPPPPPPPLTGPAPLLAEHEPPSAPAQPPLAAVAPPLASVAPSQSGHAPPLASVAPSQSGHAPPLASVAPSQSGHAPPLASAIPLVAAQLGVRQDPAVEARRARGGPELSEQLVGGRLAAWIGALLVMLAAGVFVKYAYDQGWLQRLGGLGRFSAATAGALLLIGLGEFARHRWGRAAAAGLFAAGVGSLFVIVAAGTQPNVMKVYGPGGAALNALLACALGVIVSRRSGLQSVGVVSILGAYLVPLAAGILRMEHTVTAPAYLVAVLAMSLVLAHAGPGGRALRALTLVLHGTLSVLLLWRGWTPSLTAELFVVLSWGLFLAATVAATVTEERRQIDTGELADAHPRDEADATRGEATRVGRAMDSISSDGVVITVATLFAVGASFFFAGAWSGWRDLWAWLPLGQAVLTLATAAQLSAMSVRPAQAPTAALSSLLRILGVALVGVALALLMSAEAASFAWAIMGAATVIIAARTGSRVLVVLGALALLPAAAVASWLAVASRYLGFGTLFVEWSLPGFRNASIILAPKWWVPCVVTVAAMVAFTALRGVSNPALRAIPALAAFLAWGAFALAIDGGGSGLVVAVMLPAVCMIIARLHGDRGARRVAEAGAMLVVGAVVMVAIAAVLDASGSSSLRSLALLLALGVVASGADRWSARPLILVLVPLLSMALIESLVPMRGRSGMDSAMELAVVAALAGLAACAGQVVLRPGFSSHLSRGAALWAAVAWLWSGLVMAPRGAVIGDVPMANSMNATAALVLAALGVALWRRRDAVMALAFMAVVLVAGSWDLARLVPHFAPDLESVATLRQASISAFWASLAVVTVIVGFSWRLVALRWAALLLLAVTACKVLLIDMQHAATLARVGALLVVGLLMVGTSIVYARAERRFRQGEPQRT